MTDTPRTDELVAKLDANHEIAVAFVWRQMVNHARQLERDLALERATRESAERGGELLADDLARLRAEHSKSGDAQDAVRYRFLRDGEYPETLLNVLVAAMVHKDEVDAAVDAAMKSPPKPSTNEPHATFTTTGKNCPARYSVCQDPECWKLGEGPCKRWDAGERPQLPSEGGSV